MKERLPDFIFIDTDFMSFDYKLFDGVDTVFINTAYISHGLYRKVIGLARTKGVKIVFINHQNEAFAMQKIQEVYQNR